MSDTRVQAPGTFCWCEVGVADGPAAREFYGSLFRWTVRDTPVAGGATYGILEREGRNLGGLYELPAELRARGVTPHWLPFVKVVDVDAACAKAAEAGGEIATGPQDVMTEGRMAVIRDPTGGTLALWQARDHAGAEAMGESGTPCWFELVTTDKREAGAFYSSVFGWGQESFLGAMDYTLFKRGEMSVAGMMQCTGETEETPSHWLVYFAVDDCDASARAATELGGRVLAGPMDVPQVGRFALLADPGGAMFSVIQLAPPPGDV